MKSYQDKNKILLTLIDCISHKGNALGKRRTVAYPERAYADPVTSTMRT